MPRETFISHAASDRAFVERLVGMLRRHGVPYWYSDTSIQGGQQWHDETGAALSRCDWVLVLLSPAAVRSRWVKSELPYSAADDVARALRSVALTTLSDRDGGSALRGGVGSPVTPPAHERASGAWPRAGHVRMPFRCVRFALFGSAGSSMGLSWFEP